MVLKTTQFDKIASAFVKVFCFVLSVIFASTQFSFRCDLQANGSGNVEDSFISHFVIG